MAQPEKTSSWIQEWLAAKCEEFGTDLQSVRYQDCGQLPFSEFAVWHPLDGAPDDAPLLRFRTPPRVQALWIRKELIGYAFEAESTNEVFTEVADAGTDTDRFFLVHPSQFEAVNAWFLADSEFEVLGGDEIVQIVDGESGMRMVVITSYDGNARIHAAPNSDETVSAALIET